MTYSQAWLESRTAIRCILVEVYTRKNGIETPFYMSNIGYLTEDSLTSFLPIVSTAMSVTETLSLDGSLSMSFGDIEINNLNGEYDSWLDSSTYIWVNRGIKVYIGDPSWVCTNLATVRTTFKLVFDGVIADIDSRDRETINIRVRDKLEKLNTPITEVTVGAGVGVWPGGQNNQDTIRPIVFGEVFNMTPLLIDPSTQEYLINNGNTELLIELRDNGVPIYTHNGTTAILPMPGSGTINLSTGKVRLGRALAGSLTASVQGVTGIINFDTGAYTSTTYKNTIANLIAIIVTQYGKTDISTRLTSADIDLVNFKAFDTINTQAVGLLINDKVNMLEACQELAGSIGAQIFMTKEGKLQILRLGSLITTGLSISTITDNDILHHSLSISAKTEVVAATKIGYCKNWTTQNGLQTGIPDVHKEYFTRETIPITSIDSTTQTLYKLNSEPEEKSTLLLDSTDATNEASRLNSINILPATVYTFTGTSKLLSLILGQQVTLIHTRFNLYNSGSGRIGQVISLSPNWSSGTIEVEVLI
jgi:hypothetical protein